MLHQQEIIFKEKQTLYKTTLGGSVAVIILGLLLYRFYILYRYWGNEDNGSLWVHILVLILLSLCVVLLFMMCLETKLTNKQLCVRYFPFHFTYRRYLWSDIHHAYTRTYKPIAEYGGWGLRGFGTKKKALNVSGKEGLQLIFKNGKSLLIGTQKPAAISQALKEINCTPAIQPEGENKNL